MKLTGKAVGILGLALLLVLTSVMDADAQGRGGGRGRGGRGGFSFGGFGRGGTTMVSLLARKDVAKELELVATQKESITKISASYREKQREAFSGLRSRRGGGGGNIREAFAKAQKAVAALGKETEKEAIEVLLPHQAKRAKQLLFQYTVSRGGTTGGLTRGTVSEQLKVTDKQKEALRKAAAAISKELAAKMAKLRKEATLKLIATLTPAQQKQFKALSGEAFTFEATQRTRFGGRGGRGGRGGGTQRRRRPGSESKKKQ